MKKSIQPTKPTKPLQLRVHQNNFAWSPFKVSHEFQDSKEMFCFRNQQLMPVMGSRILLLEMCFCLFGFVGDNVLMFLLDASLVWFDATRCWIRSRNPSTRENFQYFRGLVDALAWRFMNTSLAQGFGSFKDLKLQKLNLATKYFPGWWTTKVRQNLWSTNIAHLNNKFY